MLRMFTYSWLHVPTGKTGSHSREFWNEAEFLKNLNWWNRSAPGLWQYWWE